MSLPAWERGLKFVVLVAAAIVIASLPAWERGLKSVNTSNTLVTGEVAPRVGAWIEIYLPPSYAQGGQCRSPRGSVD